MLNRSLKPLVLALLWLVCMFPAHGQETYQIDILESQLKSLDRQVIELRVQVQSLERKNQDLKENSIPFSTVLMAGSLAFLFAYLSALLADSTIERKLKVGLTTVTERLEKMQQDIDSL